MEQRKRCSPTDSNYDFLCSYEDFPNRERVARGTPQAERLTVEWGRADRSRMGAVIAMGCVDEINSQSAERRA